MRVDRIDAIQNMRMAEVPKSPAPGEPLKTFGDLFKEALNRVSDANERAEMETQKLLVGEAKDLHTVMLAVAEARTMLQLAVQVRDRVVEAYREIRQTQM
jgi:flagellar hook-basal body complex protein FliE